MSLIKRYPLNYPIVLLYMLQSSQYGVGDYIAWLGRTRNFNSVMRRKQLRWTPKIMLLVCTQAILMLAFAGILAEVLPVLLAAVAFILACPFVLAYGIVVPLWLGDFFVQKPRVARLRRVAHQKIATHPGLKIAVAGSFGKTTAKEVLYTVLGEGKNVAATPGNMNTIIGNSRFIMSLKGNEDIIIFELGESHIGDVRALCQLVTPDMGFITGISEAHLSTFGTINRIIKTIFELQGYLGNKPLYKNQDSPLVQQATQSNDPLGYGTEGVDGWQVYDATSTLAGTKFTLKKGKKVITVTSGLIGMHHIGLLAAVAALGYKLGLTIPTIEAGLRKTKPFEHRMQPYQFNGAWIIDDTYNGNSQGVEAGLTLLKNCPAKRRIYVTPGLVEQSSKTHHIHQKIGCQIAGVADVVVLMQNSTTNDIKQGLVAAGYSGQLQVIGNPLAFYANLASFVAVGDVVLMQNDWTDNYE